jgi:hypothetical protein
VGVDIKGKVSPIVYLVAIAGAFVTPVISYLLYAAVALWWLVPDSRIERIFAEDR